MVSELAARLAGVWDEYAPKRGFGWDLLPDDWRDVLGPQGWNDAKDAVRYYGGPHLGGAVSDLMDGGMWAAENMTPAADVRDMMEGSEQITQGVLSNDFWRAAEGAGLLGGATMAMAVPGSVSGARKGVNAVADALPMDEASRMARAREMGFDVDAYHGTVTKNEINDFERFDRRGNRIETYFAPEANKDFANGFASADQGRVYPVKLKTGDFLDTRNPADAAALEEILSERGMVRGIDWDYAKRDGGESVLPGWGNQNVIDAVNAAGYPGMIIQERPWMESYAVFDPASVRSRFSKFDPAKKDSRDLMAGIAGAAVTPLAAALLMQREERERQY